MGLHRNARLGLAGRRALVADVEAGCSCREAARRRGVSPTTACKWWRAGRRRRAEQRRSLSCLEDRSSRPHRSPRLLPAAEQARICAARRRSGWGPRLIAGETGHPHATVWRTLRRAGISRPPRAAARAAAPLRVALPRRSAAHRQQALRPLQPARPCRHRRPPPHRRREADAGRLRVGALARRRPLPLRLQRAPPRRARRDGHRLRRAWPRRTSPSSGSSRSGCSPTTPSSTATTARSRELLRPHRIRAPLHPAAPAADQREGRALPADAQARVGPRPASTAPATTAPGPVTLARLLQHAQTTQLTRRPATDQPRPQPPEAGHLAPH